MSWYETNTQQVQAKQLNLLNAGEIEEFIGGDAGRCPNEHHGCLIFATKDGALHVRLSNYVVKDKKGRLKTEDQRIFREQYHLVRKDPYGD